MSTKRQLRVLPRAPQPVPPERDDDPEATFSRRDVIRAATGMLALASGSLFGCTRAPAQKIVPYRQQPEDVIPGRPSHYATAFTLDGHATGLVVESHEGRPTKVEGNPDHPSSLGACGAFEQSSLVELYDPRRARDVLHGGTVASDAAARAWLVRAGQTGQSGRGSGRGRGVHVVMAPTSSFLIASALNRLRSRLPETQVHFHAPVSHANAWRGTRLAFGAPLEARVDLRKSDVILAIDCDFLTEGPAHLADARAFADRRRLPSLSSDMNRLYVVESRMTVTGATADHRLAIQERLLPSFVAALIAEVGRGDARAPNGLASKLEALGTGVAPHASFVRALARDLLRHRGAAAVLVGPRQSAEMHAAVAAINTLLNDSAGPVTYAPSAIVDAGARSHESLGDLADALEAKSVDRLVVLDTDIAYASPGDLRMADRIGAANESFSLGLFVDATARACTWSAPCAHVFESWGDTRAFDGTASLVQPLVAPMLRGRTIAEALSALAGESEATAHDLLAAEWRARWGPAFDAPWERALQRGVIEGTRIAPTTVGALSWAWVDSWMASIASLAARAGGDSSAALELVMHADGRVHDGRFGDNPWLLELACPVTKLTWGNAAWLSPRTAARLAVANGDVLAIERADRTIELPVLVVPGQSDGTIACALGYGRRGEARGDAVGVDVYPMMRSTSPWWSEVRGAHRTGATAELALTQERFRLDSVEDRVVLSSTLEAARAHPNFAAPKREKPVSLYESDAPKSPRQWGMAIDLTACTGCSACVVACQAENNTPTVGKSGVLKGRQMHWLRIDRYVAGSEESPRILAQPMACQHCEKAPCEYVCPTAATVHSSDGLNQMVYNRCVGTRFCSNNCPYKVRRFNWFNYHSSETPREELVHNPDVTVRERGVMEKCTYCVQRIRETEIRARVEGREVAPDEVVTACQQACPSRAITFGNLADPASTVSRLHDDVRAFAVLNDLGTVPRTRYLARITNPNPELE